MKLNELSPAYGRPVKRLGRGDASGHGGTSTRGHKGQRARSGGYHKRAFEGGQMTLIRRLPKHGFTNIFRRIYSIVNLDQLERFPAGSEIDAKTLLSAGVLRRLEDNGLKVLGDGDLPHPLIIKANAFSKGAIEKIEKAGGKAIIV